MRWGYFVLVLIAAAVLQSTVLSLFCPAWVDLLLIMALSCAWLAPAADARLAGWLIGLMKDGLADHPSPMGLYALAFGLATMGLVRLRDMTNSELWWARWVAGFAAAWPAQLLVLIHARILQGANISVGRMIGDSLLSALAASLIAALLLLVPGRLSRQRRQTTMRW